MNMSTIIIINLLLTLCVPGLTRADGSAGPFQLYNADSSSYIRFQMAAQLRTTFESLDKGANKKRDEGLYMEARRVRFTLSAATRKPDLSFRVHLSAAPGSLELMDFYFDYKISPRFQIRYGQYKVPFTRYRIESFQQLLFADWSIVTKYFGAERQMGLSLHNGYEKPPRWGYIAGVFTGVNARASHAIGLAKFYNASLPNPSNLANSAPHAEFHPELFAHVSYNANKINVQSASDDTGGPLRYSLAFSAAWDMNPSWKQDFAARLSPEMLLKYRGASLTAVGYAGFVKIDSKVRSQPALLGFLWETAYRFKGNYEFAGRFAVVDFRDVIVNSEPLLRIMRDDKKAGQLVRDKEFGLGFNIYVIGHSLKWQNDVNRIRHVQRVETLIDYSWRSQLQLTF
jgi:hypothetical protein